MESDDQNQYGPTLAPLHRHLRLPRRQRDRAVLRAAAEHAAVEVERGDRALVGPRAARELGRGAAAAHRRRPLADDAIVEATGASAARCVLV